jgi:hypothetical protein
VAVSGEDDEGKGDLPEMTMIFLSAAMVSVLLLQWAASVELLQHEGIERP